MFDLRQLHTYYIDKYGRDAVASILDQKAAVVAMWQKSCKFPVDALQRLLEHDPEPLSAIKPLYENPPAGTKLCILMPLIGPPEPKAMDCLMRLYDRREMGFKRAAFNNLSVARNILMGWWLARDFEWAFFMDGDMVLPCGDAAAFKTLAELPNYPDAYAGLNSIYRMLSHRQKAGKMDATIVSCAYVSRSRDAIPQFGGGDRQEARLEMRLGPRPELREKPWCGFGGVLVHRSVPEDIIATQGEEIKMRPGGIGDRFGYKYSMFTPTDRETPGDDLPWCQRAARAGHKIYVDYAVQAAHIGDRAYTFADIR